MTLQQCLDYEIRASWWADRIGWKPLRALTIKYFVWKVHRKHKRWFDSRFDEAYRQLMGEKP